LRFRELRGEDLLDVDHDERIDFAGKAASEILERLRVRALGREAESQAEGCDRGESKRHGGGFL
jgi:hypothetical protein